MHSDLRSAGPVCLYGADQSLDALTRMLKRHTGSVIVICHDQRQAEALAEDLPQSAIIHPWLDASVAEKRLKKFHLGKTKSLLYVGNAASTFGIPPHQVFVVLGSEQTRDQQPKVKQKRHCGNRRKRHLQREYYPTLEEASVATKALGITTSMQYRFRLREDMRLPHSPDRFYKDWVSWGHFLGKDTGRKTTNPYPTLRAAMQASYNLGITSSVEYQALYKRDPQLPSHPEKTYRLSGWISWPHFCGTIKAA